MFSCLQYVMKCRGLASISSFRHWTTQHCQFIRNGRQLHVNEISTKVLLNKQEVFLKPIKCKSHSVNDSVIYLHICRFKSFDFSNNKKEISPIKNANSWTKWKRKYTAYERNMTSQDKALSTLFYMLSLAILTTGAAYAAVPLYRMFCSATSYGGTTKVGHDTEKVESMETKKEKLLKIRFSADTAAQMQWNFRPQQSCVDVYAGETALAFYTAKNPSDRPIDGISTYNVVPYEAGQYFNKIQCFCFEEQRLNPGEEVDMPVFFYIDPEFLDDPYLEDVDTIFLSYTFFESKPGMTLPTYNKSY